MSVYIGDVQTFAGVIADKPQVLKIGEEIMEVFSAWEDYKECSYSKELHKEALVAEIADVIQAACNLLAAVGVDDMRQPMQECYVRNSERGRKYANDTFSAENDVTAQDVDANDSREKLEADMEDAIADLIAKAWIFGSNDEKFSGYDYDIFFKLLDRQAAITERECRKPNWDYCDTCETLKDVNFECEELQEQADNQKKAAENFRDMWQKADARCSELKAENDGLKARIESLRAKLSKMLDAASEIQHIGDLP